MNTKFSKINDLYASIDFKKKKDAASFIRTIQDKYMAKDNYIYRGTNKKFSTKKNGISSSLYRLATQQKLNQTGYLPQEFEKEVVKNAVNHFPKLTDHLEILTEIQHYQGKTNLIDFSHNFFVALFFSCYEENEKKKEINGELIFFKSKKSIDKINYKNLHKEDQIVKPAATHNSKGRVNIQSSVFVYPAKGYIETKSYLKEIIPKELKKGILDWLKQFHNISKNTIFNDLIGFIQNKENFNIISVYFDQAIAIQDNPNAKPNELKEAIEYYNKILKLGTNMDSAYYNRGCAWIDLKNYLEAIKDFTKVLELIPKNDDAYLSRGNAKAFANQNEEAIKDYDLAIDSNQKNAKAYSNKAATLLKLERYKEALVVVKRALKIDTQLDKTYYVLGATQFKLKNYKGALRSLNKVIKLIPDSPGAFGYRCLTKAKLGDGIGTLSDFHKARKLGCTFKLPSTEPKQK